MTWVKYILHSIGSLFRVYVAAEGATVNANELTIGLLSLGIIGLIYAFMMAIFSIKTKLNLTKRILCSIGTTILVIGIVFAIMILVEYLVQK